MNNNPRGINQYTKGGTHQKHGVGASTKRGADSRNQLALKLRAARRPGSYGTAPTIVPFSRNASVRAAVSNRSRTIGSAAKDSRRLNAGSTYRNQLRNFTMR